jgi:hypothetical protein
LPEILLCRKINKVGQFFLNLLIFLKNIYMPDVRTIQLTHKQIAMIENALIQLSNNAFAAYQTACSLTDRDVTIASIDRQNLNAHLFDIYNGYSELSFKISNSELDV